MTDTIVEEVREIRASIAAEFGYDRTLFLAHAREQTRLRKHAQHAPSPDKALPATDTEGESYYESGICAAPHPCQS